MTGYGKAEVNLETTHFNIEVKSLNSKQIDTTIKMSSIYRSKEISIRKLISQKLHRGKIELSIWKENLSSGSNYILNTEALKDYHKQILNLKKDLQIENNISNSSSYKLSPPEIIPTLLNLPNAVLKGEDAVKPNDWDEIEKGIMIAIDNLLQFRLDEGEKLEKDIHSRIQKLTVMLNDLSPFAKLRIEKVKTRLLEKLSEIDSGNIDHNRFEQELIYYLEKQDITEEIVRLDSHLNYFAESINEKSPNGKKLGFISQEIGREINTIGSKSSDIEMQKIVVQMKDELEKIKEQLLNAL